MPDGERGRRPVWDNLAWIESVYAAEAWSVETISISTTEACYIGAILRAARVASMVIVLCPASAAL